MPIREPVAQLDYDIIVATGRIALPGNEQRGFWARRRPTSGLAQLCRHQEPAVDALIERIIFAKNREGLWPRHGRSIAF